ncbi:Phosphomevalonate kinase [Sarcoptes scabiei]|nr:Phosphomevalonate kinase [Sarcoptes scabiei]
METKERIRTLIKPKLILLLSGKRKSGKDFVERLLLERFPNSILSFRISSPIKKEFARERNLDYEELLTSSSYKENYRHKMVEWSESVRRTDPNYFLRLAIIEAYEK